MTEAESATQQIAADLREWGPLIQRLTRGLLLATGTLVFAVGLIVLVVPAAEQLLPVEEAVAVLGSDYTVVAVVGLSAVSFAAVILVARQRRTVDEAVPPVVEGVQSARYPGAEIDGTGGVGLGDSEEACRRRLRAVAVRAVANATGCSERVAETRVDNGSWTHDDVVGWWLAPEAATDADGQNNNDRTIRRTVSELTRVIEEGVPTEVTNEAESQ